MTSFSDFIDRLRSIWDYGIIPLANGNALSVGQVVLVVLLVIVSLLTSRIINRLLGRRLAKSKIGPDAAHTLQRIIVYLVLACLFMAMLSLLHVPLTAFAFVSGAIAIGVGFGAQNIINNFISGWILMVERPISIGDFVEIEDGKGFVEQIGNRSTRIRRTDGVHMLVPNSLLLERTVVNWTLVDNEIRTSVRVGVAYGSDPKLVKKLVLQATTEQGAVKTSPAPQVAFEDFGDNALIFDSFFWSDTTGETALRALRSDIRLRISELFAEQDIVVAFPQRDVHLDSLSPIEVRMMESGSASQKE